MASNENCWSPLAPETLPSRPTRTGASDVVTYNDFCLAAKHEWKTPLEVISRGKAGRTRTKTLTGEDSSFLLLVLSLALAWLPLLILFVMEGDLDQVNRGGRKKPSGRKWSGDLSRGCWFIGVETEGSKVEIVGGAGRGRGAGATAGSSWCRYTKHQHRRFLRPLTNHRRHTDDAIQNPLNHDDRI